MIFGKRLKRRLLLAAIAALIFTATASSVAYATITGSSGVTHAARARIAAGACPSLKHVKSFHGHASIRFSGTASGEDQSSGGSETVTLERKVAHAHFKLTKFDRQPGRILIAGTVTGGAVTVSDGYDNTGSDLQGKETYSGPIDDSLGSGALLVVNRETCKWRLAVDVEVKGVRFSGDAENPGTLIYQFAASSWHDIHNSLAAAASDTDHAWFLRCPKRVGEHGRACYSYDGGWSNDYDLLYRCHSIAPPVNCEPRDTPEGLADFSWSLSPTSKK